jgi:hypothetical protein
MPIFPIERSITVKSLSVRRKQIPICPAFCLTDYKVQGSTLSAAILDLKTGAARRGQDSHPEVLLPLRSAFQAAVFSRSSFIREDKS